MFSRFGRIVVLISAVLVTASCTPLPGPGDDSLATEPLSDTKTIPADWGELEGVTQLGNQAVQLWLEDDEGTIRVVVYAGRSEQLQPYVRVIRRSGVKEASHEPAD